MLRSSYHPAEVSFLLTDLSGHALELSLDEREKAIAAGRNYAEMLPIEFAPSAEYLALFDALLGQFASELAEHVGVVTEMALAARRQRPVLVSLARAGTPVGILMRRWALFSRNIELPHYSVSIVRGRGIDTVALDYITARHDPRDVLFVDGWTGKGAIATELAQALAAYAAAGGPSLSGDLAVIADPGFCSALFGTRQDILVPSACLNSTVCGLVSRTVLNDLIRPGMFHGAKVYAELAGGDRSAQFLDAVSGHFPRVAAAVAERWPAAWAADRPLTFAGQKRGTARPGRVRPAEPAPGEAGSRRGDPRAAAPPALAGAGPAGLPRHAGAPAAAGQGTRRRGGGLPRHAVQLHRAGAASGWR